MSKKVLFSHLTETVDDNFVSGKGQKINKSNYKLNTLVPIDDLGIDDIANGLQYNIDAIQLVATGTLTSAQILALNATPITLIAAPGANKTIIVDEIQLFLDYNSATYVAGAGEDLTFQYATGNVGIAAIDNDAVTFLTASADAHWLCKPAGIYAASVAGTGDGVLLTTIDNEGIEVTIASGEVATGDSPIKWKIKYHVVTNLS